MVTDHLCIPVLDRPVTVSEYAKLTGVREAEGLAAIRALKIRCAHSNGEWWVEAPPNCEARRVERPAFVLHTATKVIYPTAMTRFATLIIAVSFCSNAAAAPLVTFKSACE